MLRRIIAEEVQNLNTREIFVEGTNERPVQVTPAYINRIIQEELNLHRDRQRLAEARQRRLRARRIAEARQRRLRARRIAEARRRRSRNYY